MKLAPSLIFLGEALKTLRRERGLTQGQLAEQAGIHNSYVSMIERGERNPTWSVLCRICQELDMDVSELAKRVEDLGRK